MKGCDTCCKSRRRRGRVKCKVLTENIGLTGNCWAWTDDKEWYNKAQIATEVYRQKKGGENA